MVSNNLLGIWNTRSGAVPDGSYQLRLRVFLTDGSDGGTVVVNNIRVRNQAPTPQPTNTPLISRPIAAFNPSVSSGNAPLTVQLVNQSSGQNVSYTWNFDDGTTSNAINPSHTFTSPGVYTVTLTASNAGGTSNVSRQITVQAANPPVASFSASPTSGSIPLTVSFTDQSTGGQIERWEWNFGDGDTSDQQNPIHIFDAAGIYNVILTVRGPGGSSFATRQVTVSAPDLDPPIASFQPNQAITDTVPFTVNFQNTTTGEVDEYRWDFGDNTLISTQANPSHTYTVPGEYTVRMTASGPGGETTTSVNITALGPLAADFTAIPSTNDPLQLDFNAQAVGGTGRYTYTWDFGNDETSSAASPRVTYDSAGEYQVTLTVDDGEDQASETKTVEVFENLAADFAFTVDEENTLTVNFTAQPSGGTGEYTYFWDFGDGTQTSTEAEPQVTYAESGVYTVTLVVNDGDDEVVVSKEIQVESNTPDLAADFSVTPVEGEALQVRLMALPTGGTGNYSVLWDFGDPSIPISEEVNPVVTFPTGGTYNVTLTVDDGESTAQDQQQITLQGELSATFSVTPGETDPLTVNVTAQASGGTGNYTYGWDFGNGQTGTGATTQVTYASGGTYTVTLTVDDGQTTAQAAQTVEVTEPVEDLTANFTVTPSETDPLTVNANAQASGGTGNYTYGWDFGDGQTGTGATTQVTYASGGTYTVTLTVNDGQTTAQAAQTVEVTEPVEDLTANFTVTPGETDPLTVNVTAQASGGTGNYTYGWDFGDGQTGTGATTQVTYASGGTYTVTLTVNDGQTTAQAAQTVEVTEPVEDLTANFTVTPSETDPLTVNFTSQISGGIPEYAYFWDFGNGQTSTDPNPQMTYSEAGTYTVTFIVTDANGDEARSEQEVTVTAPAEPLIADFSVEQTEDNPLQFQFMALPTGGTGNYTLSWDFGNGQTSTDPNPLITYDASGTYTVTLTVNDGVNPPATTTQEVEVIDSDPTSDTVRNAPLLPEFGPIEQVLRQVFQAGQAREVSRNPLAFIAVGDETAASASFLDPFANAGQDYTSDGTLDNLDGVIAAYNTATIAPGGNSFNRDSVAAGTFTADQLINESQPCNGGEALSRVQCEINTVNPAVAIVSVGYNDVLQNTDPAAFRTQFESIIQTLLDADVIPIVTTVYPVPGSEQQASDINEAIIEVAEAQQVPLVNIWRGFDDQPNALDADGNPTVDPQGVSYLSTNSTAGVTLRNGLTLAALSELSALLAGLP